MQAEYLKTHKPTKVKKSSKVKRYKRKYRPKLISDEYLKLLNKNRLGLIANITRSEKIFKEMLDTLDIKYNFQKIFTVGRNGYIVDFYLKNYSLVVEIDGDNHKTQDEKDNKRTVDLLTSGKINHVIRFYNDEISCMTIDDLKRELAIKICPFIEDLL